jgi:DegV family protein with EDD domain
VLSRANPPLCHLIHCLPLSFAECDLFVASVAVHPLFVNRRDLTYTWHLRAAADECRLGIHRPRSAQMRVRVLTDSSTNVPDSYLAQLSIIELPALVNFGTQSFLNKVELSTEEFYRRLAAADTLPTTAQPLPKHFAAAYEQAAAEGADEAVVVVVSGRMSGTLNAAAVAAETAPIKVHLWDSMSASMARDGLDALTILAQLERIRARMQAVTTPATLRNLIAGGRAPKLKGNIGELLDIKPILAMVDGLLEPVGQARGRRKAVAEVLARVAEAVGDQPVRVAVTHANVAGEAAQFAQTVQTCLNVAELVVTDLGPVLATLAGPGIIALCAYTLE